MTWRRELDDTLDASMEMPEQYGDRSYWRYQHVSALVGLVVFPVLLLLNVVSVPSYLQDAAGIAIIIFMVAVAIYFIRLDRVVQNRLDETGSPLADKEPY